LGVSLKQRQVYIENTKYIKQAGVGTFKITRKKEEMKNGR